MSTLLLVPHALPHQECASPDERLLKDEGTQRRPHGLPLVPLRPQRVKRLLEPLCTPPTALPQSARALAAPRESLCCIDGVARARVSRKTLFEDRQHPARTISRVARDLTKFVFAQRNLV